MDLEKLRLIEARVEEILTQHARLCEERDQLSQRLAAVESQFLAVSDRLQEYERERAEIKSRVERILGRLDGIDLS
jgi:chromosome segregation ATPase